MPVNSIIVELRRVRDDLAARFNYDLEAIIADSRMRQAAGGRKVVNLTPRPSELQAAVQSRREVSPKTEPALPVSNS